MSASWIKSPQSWLILLIVAGVVGGNITWIVNTNKSSTQDASFEDLTNAPASTPATPIPPPPVKLA